LIATGTQTAVRRICAPEVSFDVDENRICPGGLVTLLPSINNAPNDSSLSVLWRFPGGTPATSTLLRPTVSYAAEGNYNVEFVAFNRAGRDSVTRTNAVFVSANTPAYVALRGDVEGFEDAAFPQVGSSAFSSWTLEGGSSGWTASTIAAQTGSRALRIFAGGQASGSTVSAITPKIDLTGTTTNVVLRYKYAAARRSSSNTDILKIYTSVNCGKTFGIRVQRRGTTGAFAAYTTQSFFPGSFRPQAADWRTETISLQALAGQDDVRIKFELNAGGGNNFYIDSLTIFDPTLTSVQAVSSRQLIVAPNPAEEAAQVTLPKVGAYTFQLLDVFGRLVGSGKGEDNVFTIPVHGYAAGAYVLRVQQAGHMYHHRLLVEAGK
jgi:PKD repeat protein